MHILTSHGTKILTASQMEQIQEMLAIVVATIVLDYGFIVAREGKELNCWMLTEDECNKIGAVLYNHSQIPSDTFYSRSWV
jgi:hypothetical protein